MTRIVVLLAIVLGAACDDRIVELTPPPDGPSFDGNLDGPRLLDAGDGGAVDADIDGGVGDGGIPGD